jgi:hypothetical protein
VELVIKPVSKKEMVCMLHETASCVEEKLNSLFQPDILLSAQYYDSLRGKTGMESERRLMLAVLRDAVACFQNYIFARDRRGKRLFDEAEDWILQEDDEQTFSFKSICEVLGFNPGCVRQGLVRWKKKRLARHARSHRGTPERKKRAEQPRVVFSRGRASGVSNTAVIKSRPQVFLALSCSRTVGL